MCFSFFFAPYHSLHCVDGLFCAKSFCFFICLKFFLLFTDYAVVSPPTITTTTTTHTHHNHPPHMVSLSLSLFLYLSISNYPSASPLDHMYICIVMHVYSITYVKYRTVLKITSDARCDKSTESTENYTEKLWQ